MNMNELWPCKHTLVSEKAALDSLQMTQCGKDLEHPFPNIIKHPHFEFLQALGPDLCKQFVGVQLEAFCEDLGPWDRGGLAAVISSDKGVISPLETSWNILEMRGGSTALRRYE